MFLPSNNKSQKLTNIDIQHNFETFQLLKMDKKKKHCKTNQFQTSQNL